MYWIRYFFARLLCKFRNDDEVMNRFYRKAGVKIGKDCHIYSNIAAAEGYLIEIGDHVTISNDVQLVTHDNSICKVLPQFTDIFGKIIIGDNCFIGARTVIMRGVTLPPNTIVGAGSVVTKSFTEQRQIIAGNPARVIGDWEHFAKKFSEYAINISNLTGAERRAAIIESAERTYGR
ncbi:MAG: acyltransferase [Christensenellales bacterium]|nr:acyltransferase [Christensenellales bacterium]